MIAALTALIESRLQGAGVFVGERSTYPYVVVYPSLPMRSSESLDDRRERGDFTFQTTVVAVSRAQALAELDRVAVALEPWRPVVAGRVAWKVQHTWSRPVDKDDSLADRAVYSAMDTWVLSSSS